MMVGMVTQVVKSMRGLYDICYYLTGTNLEVVRLDVGLRGCDRINF